MFPAKNGLVYQMKIHRPILLHKKYNAHRQTMRVVLYHVCGAA